MIFSFILTVFASYVDYLISTSQLRYNSAVTINIFKCLYAVALEDNYTQILLELSYKCKMEMNRYLTITEHCKNFIDEKF